MGGEGSGRHPSVETMMKRGLPEQTPIGDSLFLPNYSGVQAAALKTAAAIGVSHTRLHAVTDILDHTSTATSGKILKADANGLPVNATNTDADVADAVTKKHTQNTDTAVANDAITLAMMAAGTDGNLITYDAAGDPAYVATGNSGQVLTSNGAGAAPTFQAAAGGESRQTFTWFPIKGFEASVGQGTWVNNTTDATVGYYSMNNNTTNNDGDNITFNVFLNAGSWKIGVASWTNSNLGIMEISVDGAVKYSFDWYTAGYVHPVVNISGATAFTVAAGTHAIKLAVNGKNGASSDHRVYFGPISFIPQ